LVRSCYAEGKRAGETLCVCWSHQYGVPTKIVRPGHTYGPGMRLDDGRVHADFVSDVIHNRNIIMKSSGSAKRTFCYLADAIVGIFTVLFKGNNAQAYNVGDKITEISIGDLARLLVELFPEKNLRIEINEQMKPEGYLKSKTPRICLDSAKLKSLGWEQHYLLEEGFRRTIRSFL
ncbi:MAG: NAD-dependent epimerase/dehydratase family protein, partial [Candidatus Omnitrophica bacterium]|nr:NAD-dependent epimerase/dehydratase family protein [Candidatus Omnitrophota bacterium]